MSVAKEFHFQGIDIYIEDSVMDLFTAYKQHTKQDREGCGILMCSVDKNNSDIYINYVSSFTTLYQFSKSNLFKHTR